MLLHGDGHLLGEVALGHRADHAAHLIALLSERPDERVDRVDLVGPLAVRAVQPGPGVDPAFFGDGVGHPIELVGRLVVEEDDVVEGGGHLLVDLAAPDLHAAGEIALFDLREHPQELLVIDASIGLRQGDHSLPLLSFVRSGGSGPEQIGIRDAVALELLPQVLARDAQQLRRAGPVAL